MTSSKTPRNMKHYSNLSYLLPKRDLSCFDLEDLPAYKLRQSFTKEPDYFNQVPESIIVEELNIFRESYIVEELDELYDEDITPITLPPFPLWYTITPEQILTLGKTHEQIEIEKFDGELQRLSDASIENYRRLEIEDIGDSVWMDQRNEFFRNLLTNEPEIEARIMSQYELKELITELSKDPSMKRWEEELEEMIITAPIEHDKALFFQRYRN